MTHCGPACGGEKRGDKRERGDKEMRRANEMGRESYIFIPFPLYNHFTVDLF